MPRNEEITFADHLGRFYAHRYAFPPMVGRVLGYLLVCEPRDQSIAELSEALLASRSAITGALDVLERIHAIQRSHAGKIFYDAFEFEGQFCHSISLQVGLAVHSRRGAGTPRPTKPLTNP